MVRVPCACAHSDSEPRAAGEADAAFDARRLIPAMHDASLFPSIGRRHGLIPRPKLINCRANVAHCLACWAIAVALAAHAAPLSPTRAGPPAVTVGGPFTLMASDGTTVTDKTYAGKWLLVYFGYTFCPDRCPTTLLDIARALQKLGADAGELQPLFITVDPQRDTPDVLGKYIQSFDPRIVGLTGTPQQIASVAHEYGAYFARRKTGPGVEDYVMDHSSYLYVMDPEGKFVRGFAADAPTDYIAGVLRKLMDRSPGEARDGGLTDEIKR